MPLGPHSAASTSARAKPRDDGALRLHPLYEVTAARDPFFAPHHYLTSVARSTCSNLASAMTIPNTSSSHETKRETQDSSITRSSSSTVKPLPLTQALHANLSLLLRNLGNLLSYQAHLRYNNTNPASASPQSIQSLPGWNDVARAALKWQADVTALHRWTKEAQEALVFEHTKAKAREAKEEEERQRKLGEEEKAAAAAAAAKEAEQAAAAKETKPSSTTTTSSSAAPSRPESKGGDSVIDLTADEDEDDAKPLSSKAPKRPAEDSGGAAPDDDASIAKKPKLDAASADTSAAGTGADSSADAVSALLTSVNKGADSTASTAAQQGGASAPAPLDMSSMGLGDLSGVDFSVFMNMDGMGGGNAASNNSGSAGGGGAPDLSSMSDLDFASFTGGDTNTNTNIGGGMGSFDAASGGPLTGAASGGNFNFSQDPSQGGLDGMDFTAALEGVDWSSLIGTFGDGQQSGGGGGS